MIASTIVLLDAYGSAVLRAVVADMIARGVHDRGAMAILCERRRRRSRPAPLVLELGQHVVERESDGVVGHPA